MDLHLARHSYNEELNYYIKGECKLEGDNFSVLGFKNNCAVIEPSIDQPKKSGQIKIIKNLPSKLSLSNFQFDESGEKYINLNGQKLKVVPQGKIPDEVRKRTMLLKHKMINIGSLKNPLKVRVISSATQLNKGETLHAVNKPQTQDKLPLITQDKSNKLPGIKKIKLISPKVLQSSPSSAVIHADSSHTTSYVNPKVVVVKVPLKQTVEFDTSPDYVVDPYAVPLNQGLGLREKLLCRENLKILNKVKMQALNLSKKKIEKLQVATQDNLLMKGIVHRAAQTDFIEFPKATLFSDKVVQTDIQRSCQENIGDLFDFDLFSMFDSGESPVLNNVNFGTGPSIGKLQNTSEGGSQTIISATGKIMGHCIGGKQLNEEKMKKQLLFFTDLRECLSPNISGNLLIHEGVINNDTPLVKRMCTALKARRAGVNLENHNGCTPLQLAVINNANVDIVQTLLDAGADISEADGEGNNILHLGAKFERHRVLEVILYHDVMRLNPNCINSFNFEGLTPLMICCISSWTDGAILLIQHKADVNLKDQTSGRTALFHAAEALNVDIVRLLLDHKADPKIKNFFGTSPHDAMYELEDMPDKIKNLIFGKTKKRTIEAEMNPVRTAKAAKNLKTFSKLQKIERKEGVILAVPPRSYKIAREVK